MSQARFFLIAAVVLVLDQLTKLMVLANLPEGHSHPILPGVLMLTHIRNPGTAFGLLRGSGPLLTVITIAAVLFIISYWLYVRKNTAVMRPILLWGLALPLGGALGNLMDRLRLGHVVDFIDFRVWPVFNVADSAITVGACLVAYYFFVIQDAHAPAAEGTPRTQGAE